MTTRATTLALVLTSVSLALPASAQQAPQPSAELIPAHAERGGDHRRGEMGRRGGMERIRTLFEAYDANEDGSLTQAEIDAGRASQFEAADTDATGGLTLEEYETLWLEVMRERMVDQFQRHDDDGDGIVTVEEFNERTRNLVSRMDRNGDDALSRDDMRRGARPAE
ncbi:MAG: hypothetical protein AAFY59_02420 [Pseudomonadota bacterium]